MRKPMPKRPDPMTPDLREERLVSWAKQTIDTLRRENREMRVQLDHQADLHKGSEVALRRFTGSGFEDVPLPSGTHIAFYVPNPRFPEQRCRIEVFAEKSAVRNAFSSMTSQGESLIVTSDNSALKIIPRASNMVHVAAEIY